MLSHPTALFTESASVPQNRLRAPAADSLAPPSKVLRVCWLNSVFGGSKRPAQRGSALPVVYAAQRSTWWQAMSPLNSHVVQSLTDTCVRSLA